MSLDPASPAYESAIDRQIREAMERGEFDDLPGAGKPLPGIDQPRDDLWWVKGLMQREKLRLPAPPALALRAEVSAALARAADAPTPAAVRRIVADINARIAEVNAKPIDGPPSRVAPVDVDEVLAAWRDQRARDGETPTPRPGRPPGACG